MADHMTAEQLREQSRNVELYARTKLDEVEDIKAACFALTAVANSLGQIAARLSGMAAVPVGHVVVPRKIPILLAQAVSVSWPISAENTQTLYAQLIATVESRVYEPEHPHG